MPQGRRSTRGLALFFPAPNSYTGEDVLELQGHGGPVVLQLLLARCLEAAGERDEANGRERLPHLRIATPASSPSAPSSTTSSISPRPRPSPT
jgi:tRNA modification GTPase